MRIGNYTNKKGKKHLLRASFGNIGYIDIFSSHTKSVYGKNNSKSLQDALKKANKALDNLYEKYQ